MIKKLLIKSILLFIPFILLGSFFIPYLIKKGELYFNYEDLLSRYKSEPTSILGLAYTNPMIPLKIAILKHHKYDVVVLGSSRTLSFRSLFFKNGTSFYNAGGTIRLITHFRSFLSKIPKEYYPKILIIGLDQYAFNAQSDVINTIDPTYISSINSTYFFFETLQNCIIGLLNDIKRGKISLKEVFSIFKPTDHTKIGMRALFMDSGFIYDGSYYYSSEVISPNNPKLEDYHFNDMLNRIAKGNGLFEWGQEIDPAALNELKLFLEDCKSKNIHVVGFIPPYAQEVYDTMLSLGDKYTYIKKLYPAVLPLFKEKGYTIMDFSDLKSFGAHKEEVVDGFHASETAYLRIFLKLSSADSVLASYAADTKYLEKRLASPYNSYMTFSRFEMPG